MSLPFKSHLRASALSFGAVVAIYVPSAARSQVSAAQGGAPPPPTARDAQVAWLQANAAPIRPANATGSDFADLAPLGKAIGAARFVLLGEQSDGDGTTITAKARIIRYLHEQLGFDVLAFESGFYDTPRAWAGIVAGDDAVAALRSAVPSALGESAEFDPLIDYIAAQRKGARPLEVTGFDSRFTGSATGEHFRQDLGAFIDRHGIDTATFDNWAAFSDMLDSLVEREYTLQRPTTAQQQAFLAVLDAFARRIDSIGTGDADAAYWRQLCRSARVAVGQLFSFEMASRRRGFAGDNARDAQMADNFAWLERTRYPGKKIVVWTHTARVVRNTATIDAIRSPRPYNQLVPFGDLLSKRYGNAVYAIAFVSSQGQTGSVRMTRHRVPPPAPANLEGLFASTKLDNAFLDLRGLPASGAWLRAPLTSTAVNGAALGGDWTKLLDGVVYLRTMAPATESHR